MINNTGGPPPGNISNAHSQEFYDAFTRLLVCSHEITMHVLPGMKKKDGVELLILFQLLLGSHWMVLEYPIQSVGQQQVGLKHYLMKLQLMELLSIAFYQGLQKLVV